MFYYLVRDIGTANEIEKFISQAHPSEQTVQSLLRHYSDFSEDKQMVANLSIETDHGESSISFPHRFVAVTGHAGSGKTHILKHFMNRKRTMFYAPTNPAGINLETTLFSSTLFASERKKIYRTIHSFYKIVPQESNILGHYVQQIRKGQETHASFEDYLITMYRGCKPFCDKLFEKEMNAEKVSPTDYIKYKREYCRLYSIKKGDFIHDKVIQYMLSLGLGKKIPRILLYDVCVLEEAGRTPDYMAFLFLFYYYEMHMRYQTYIWRQKIPALVFVGSPTQSQVIDNFTPFSALTFMSQNCVKKFIEESNCAKIKSFKDNRRVTAGNIDKNTTLAACVGKLEVGRSIEQRLRENFNSSFVTSDNNFFDARCKPHYFRIAKRHEDLKLFKSNVYKQNQRNIVEVQEHFLTQEDVPSFGKLEAHINAKFRSETYDEFWANAAKTVQMFEQDLHVYKSSRTCLKGFRYLLTEYHSVYIHSFVGTIEDFANVTDKLQTYIFDSRSSCSEFFVDCANYMIEDIFSNRVEEVAKSVNDFVNNKCSKDEDSASIQKLLSLKTMLHHVAASTKNEMKVYSFDSEKRGTQIALPKDIFTFILMDVEFKKARGENDLDSACMFLQLESCLMTRMYPKTKSISTCEIQDSKTANGDHQRPLNFQKFKRKRSQYEDDDDEQEEEYLDLDNGATQMQDMMNQLINKSFFRFFPLVLHICGTIDSTQGLTIDSPIFALLRKGDRAEDMIVALTRTSNPDNLLVANKIFDQKYEQISYETRSLIKTINQAQKVDGWL